jgi:hypothetical protein
MFIYDALSLRCVVGNAAASYLKDGFTDTRQFVNGPLA